MIRNPIPPLRLSLPDQLASCVHCRGTGIENGLLVERACYWCNGFGKIDGAAGEMGEAIPEHVLIPALVKCVGHLRLVNKNLKLQVAAAQPYLPPLEPNVYSGKMRYKGD